MKRSRRAHPVYININPGDSIIADVIQLWERVMNRYLLPIGLLLAGMLYTQTRHTVAQQLDQDLVREKLLSERCDAYKDRLDFLADRIGNGDLLPLTALMDARSDYIKSVLDLRIAGEKKTAILLKQSRAAQEIEKLVIQHVNLGNLLPEIRGLAIAKRIEAELATLESSM
jgi:hypothetical protein